MGRSREEIAKELVGLFKPKKKKAPRPPAPNNYRIALDTLERAKSKPGSVSDIRVKAAQKLVFGKVKRISTIEDIQSKYLLGLSEQIDKLEGKVQRGDITPETGRKRKAQMEMAATGEPNIRKPGLAEIDVLEAERTARGGAQPLQGNVQQYLHGPQRVQSTADYEALEPGDTYIDPQGNRRIKK